MLNETPCPVMPLDIAQVGITGQNVLVDNAVLFTIDTMPAMHTVGKLQGRIDLLQVRIVEFVCRDQGLLSRCSWPWM